MDLVHWYRMEMGEDAGERNKLNDELVGPLIDDAPPAEVELAPYAPTIAPPKWWRGNQNASSANMAAIKMAEARRKR